MSTKDINTKVDAFKCFENIHIQGDMMHCQSVCLQKREVAHFWGLETCHVSICDQ